MQLKPWHLLALAGLVYACAKPKSRPPGPIGSGDPTPEPAEPLDPVRELYFWAHDESLILPAFRAAKRIEAATGIKIHINDSSTDPNSIKTSLPIFGSDYLCRYGTEGVASEYGIAMARNCEWDVETVLVHEMIHHLGVGHLVLPQRGIMNHGNENPLKQISEDDINAICAVRHCTTFEPETP